MKGLKQTSKNWYDRLKIFLLDENFQQSKSQSFLGFKREDTSLICFITWIDDIITLCSDLEQIKTLKK